MIVSQANVIVLSSLILSNQFSKNMELSSGVSSKKDKETKAQTQSNSQAKGQYPEVQDRGIDKSAPKKKIVKEQKQKSISESQIKYYCKSEYDTQNWASINQQKNFNSQNLKFEFSKDKSQIREADIKFRNFSLKRHQFVFSYISDDYSIVEVVVYISYYSIRIRIKNLFQEQPAFEKGQFSSGGFGKCYKVKTKEEDSTMYCLKQVIFKKPQLYIYDELDKTLKEVAIYKLASFLKIAPEFKTIELISNKIQEHSNSSQLKQKGHKILQSVSIQDSKYSQTNNFDIVVYSTCAIFMTELCVPLNQYLSKIDYQQDLSIQINKINQNISDGLDKLHYMKIVHRDIKPGNIVYSTILGKYVLCDFGLSHAINSAQSKVKYFSGTVKYSLPQLQSAYKQKKQTIINLCDNDKYALKLTIIQCSKFLNFQSQNNFFTQKINILKIFNQKFQDNSSNNNIDIQQVYFQFLKRIYGFNKEIVGLWQNLIIKKKLHFQQILKRHNTITDKTKRQMIIYQPSFINKYQDSYLNILLQKSDVDQIVAIQQSQGYISYALENLYFCLKGLKNKRKQNINKQFNFMLAIIMIQREYYFRLDPQLMKQFEILLGKYQNKDKIVYEFMLRFYHNQSYDIELFKQQIKVIQEISLNYSSCLLKSIQKLLFFVVGFGYNKNMSQYQVIIFQLILKIRRKNRLVFDYQLAQIYTKLGKSYADLQYSALSQVIMLEIVQQNDVSSQVVMSQVHDSKSQYYFVHYKWKQCSIESEKALKIYKKNFNSHSLSYAMTLNNYCHSLQNQGKNNFDQIIKYREQSLRLRQKNIGVRTIRYCFCLFDLISVYEYRQNQQQLNLLYGKSKFILYSLRDLIEQQPYEVLGRLIWFYYKAGCSLDQYSGWNFVNPKRFFSFAAYFVLTVRFWKKPIAPIMRKQIQYHKISQINEYQKIKLLYERVKKYSNHHQFQNFYKIIFYLLYKTNMDNPIYFQIIKMFEKEHKDWITYFMERSTMKLPYYLDQLI